jgi:hypothetical protein
VRSRIDRNQEEVITDVQPDEAVLKGVLKVTAVVLTHVSWW